MIVIGVTGSIGMGKTAVAQQFHALGAAYFCSDAAVHQLLAPHGAAVKQVAEAFPGALVAGHINRERLGKQVFGDERLRKKLEAIIHPLVVTEQQQFLQRAKQQGAEFCVLDIPLLFETGAEGRCDVVVVASAPLFIQKRRVMARPGMTEEKFKAILSSQMPDSEKRKRADFMVPTGLGKAVSMRYVKRIMEGLRAA